MEISSNRLHIGMNFRFLGARDTLNSPLKLLKVIESSNHKKEKKVWESFVRLPSNSFRDAFPVESKLFGDIKRSPTNVTNV